MSEKQIKTIHKSPQVKENLKNKKKKNQPLQIAEQVSFIFYLYIALFTQTL